MCTITLINHTSNSSEFIITSNRDEATGRKTFLPDYETYADVQLFFPKDAEAGGSWIGVSELNRIACLMNGAEEAHQRKSSYRLSRGVVLKDFLSSNDLDESMKNYNFEIRLLQWLKRCRAYLFSSKFNISCNLGCCNTCILYFSLFYLPDGQICPYN